MAYKFFVLPFDEAAEQFETDAFEKFTNRIIVKRCEVSFFQHQGRTYWTAFVEFMGAATSKPEHNLTEAQLQVYEALRAWRNDLAEQEGLPPYTICKNKVLENIASLEEVNLKSIFEIKGMGGKKGEKYGKQIIQIIQETKTLHGDT